MRGVHEQEPVGWLEGRKKLVELRRGDDPAHSIACAVERLPVARFGAKARHDVEARQVGKILVDTAQQGARPNRREQQRSRSGGVL